MINLNCALAKILIVFFSIKLAENFLRRKAIADNGFGIAEVGVKQRERLCVRKLRERQQPSKFWITNFRNTMIAEVKRAKHIKWNKMKPKTLLPNPIAKIRNVSEGHPERNSVERVKTKSCEHRNRKYYINGSTCLECGKWILRPRF